MTRLEGWAIEDEQCQKIESKGRVFARLRRQLVRPPVNQVHYFRVARQNEAALRRTLRVCETQASELWP